MWIFLHWIPDLINVAPSWSVRPVSSQINTYSVITKSRQGFNHVSCTQITSGLTINLLSSCAPCYQSSTSVNYLNNVTHEVFNAISAPPNAPLLRGLVTQTLPLLVSELSPWIKVEGFPFSSAYYLLLLVILGLSLDSPLFWPSFTVCQTQYSTSPLPSVAISYC